MILFLRANKAQVTTVTIDRYASGIAKPAWFISLANPSVKIDAAIRIDPICQVMFP